MFAQKNKFLNIGHRPDKAVACSINVYHFYFTLTFLSYKLVKIYYRMAVIIRCK